MFLGSCVFDTAIIQYPPPFPLSLSFSASLLINLVPSPQQQQRGGRWRMTLRAVLFLAL